eukprot:gene3813-7595_t
MGLNTLMALLGILFTNTLTANGFVYKNVVNYRSRRVVTETTLFADVETVNDMIKSSYSEIRLEPWELFCNKLQSGWIEGLSKGSSPQLEAMMTDNTIWDNPYVSTAPQLREGFQKFAEFFDEPALIFFNSSISGKNQLKIEYQISFWYPAPWRPRIIIPATAIITTNPDFTNIISVKEKWDVTVPDIFLKQFLPRLWDVWHVFCSPSPEYPPTKLLGSSGKVSFVEVPRTVAVEATWTGLAKFPGPPLLTVPGFSLFGELRTSRPNRDVFYTVLPIEVQSSRYTSTSGIDMKRSSWIFHIPTALQSSILNKAKESHKIKIANSMGEAEGEDDLVDILDYQVGLENLDLMKRVTAGATRGDFDLNKSLLEEFSASENKEYSYKILPKRIIAQMDIFGDANSEKISEAIKLIKETIVTKGSSLLNKPVKIMQSSSIFQGNTDGGNEGDLNQLGLQLCNIKGCFNMKAEPAMAIYEMQYKQRLTRVFLETIDAALMKGVSFNVSSKLIKIYIKLFYSEVQKLFKDNKTEADQLRIVSLRITGIFERQNKYTIQENTAYAKLVHTRSTPLFKNTPQQQIKARLIGLAHTVGKKQTLPTTKTRLVIQSDASASFSSPVSKREHFASTWSFARFPNRRRAKFYPKYSDQQHYLELKLPMPNKIATNPFTAKQKSRNTNIPKIKSNTPRNHVYSLSASSTDSINGPSSLDHYHSH